MCDLEMKSVDDSRTNNLQADNRILRCRIQMCSRRLLAGYEKVVGIGVIYAFARSRVGTDSILWLMYLTKTAMITKIYFYSAMEEKEYEPLTAFRKSLGYVSSRKKLFASAVLTHKDTIYIISKGRI